MDEAILINLEIPEVGVKAYRVVHVFTVGAEDKQYCALSEAEEKENPEILFLRCRIEPANEADDDEQVMSVELIPTEEEYGLVSATYMQWLNEALKLNLRETLEAEPDFFVVPDKDGNEVSFIAHAIFDDEANGRSYIAVQQVLDDGSIAEEISFYRFIEGEPCNIDNIKSDMEYARVKDIFLKLTTGS